MTGCWCQRAYDTGFTGNPRTDQFLIAREVDPSWFRDLHDFYARGGTHNPDLDPPADAEYVPELGRLAGPIFDLHTKWRRKIEEKCPAVMHYPRLALDFELGRDVTTSFDREHELHDAQDEAILAWLHRDDPRAVDYDAELVAEASGRDVLTFQRLPRFAQAAIAAEDDAA